MKVSALLLVSGLAAAAAGGNARAAESFSADYSVSLFGLPIARSSFTTTIDGDRFETSGSLSSAGVAKIFDDTEGTIAASGSLANDAVRPDRYQVSYTSGDKKKMTAITFSDGDVAETENVPPLRKRKNYVALGEGDLRAVADPLSATLVKADGLDQVCERTIRVFDGELRADLQLTTVSREPLWGGRDGEAVTCQARFVPVSGYRKGHDSIEFLRDEAKILIAFAELGSTGVYAPVQASVSTEIGTVRIEAQRMEQR